MVAQRMGSQGGGSNGTGKTQTQNRIHTQDPLSSQGSFYSLTLDGVQNQLGDMGKPLSSMNLDELLKTLSKAEANNQATGGVDGGPAAHHPLQPAPGSSFNQPSTLVMSMDLSRKTVDEVWHNIQQGQKRSNLDRKATLGEMTLEDFLVKAGVVSETRGKKNLGSVKSGPSPVGLPRQAQWMNCQIPLVHPQQQQQQQQQQSMVSVFSPGHPVQQPIPLAGNPTMDAAYSETQTARTSSPLMGTLSDTQTPGRKRVAPDDIVEKSVERRQKRMIKNRESAARSRARKQAYTHELENKVSRLEEENDRLRRQKELEKALPAMPLLEPKYQLRRTRSAPT